MKNVFITSTLKSEWNKKFNTILCQKIEERKVNCYLPQRDTNQEASELDIFNQNTEGIRNSKKVLTVGVNESINWGLETGYAFGLGKKIILLTEKDYTAPTMSLGMFFRILRVEKLDDIDSYLDQLVKVILE